MSDHRYATEDEFWMFVERELEIDGLSDDVRLKLRVALARVSEQRSAPGLGLGLRVRAWVVGAALIASGFITHAVFEIWAAPYAGRIEMGQFACYEAILYTAGLTVVFVSLSTAPPRPSSR